MSNPRLSCIVVLLPILLFGGIPLAAQVTTGSISGYVFDPSGKPIVYAQVNSTDLARSMIRETTTDNTGFFRFAKLQPASYSISSVSPGFEKITIREVRVEVNAHVRVDLRLPVAAINQAVMVSTTVLPTQTESSELGAVLDQETIHSLPLNRRDFLQLGMLTPGVFPPVEDSELSQRGGFSMHANGGRETYNNYLLDGIDNNDPYVSRYVLQPPVDSIQEFKIATNSYSAEYGRSAAGQVNVITRRGTNEFHGFAYEYLRNRSLDARNFFDGLEKPKYIRNQFGVGLGGPVVRDRTFFFANVDFLRARQGLSRLGTVPTAALRQGDLSSLGTPVVDPFTRQRFPGNIIPPGRISPTAKKILELFPLPNRPGTAGNYLPNAVERENNTQANMRVDHRLSPKDELSLRYSRGYMDLFEPYTEGTAAIPGFGDYVSDPAHNAMIQYQRILGPRTVNSVQFGFSRFSREILPENSDSNVGELWGVSWLNVRSRDYGYPAINVAGFSKVGDATSLPILRHTNTFQLIDNLSLSRGKHLFKIGGEVRRLQLNGVLDLLTRGSLSMSGYISGSGISDLLLGLPSFGLQSQADNPITMRSTAYDGYFHDDWKILPNLTLNLGLRYEYNTPPVDPTNRMSAFSLTTGKVVEVGTEGVSRSGIRPDYTNFAPRAGVAWSPARDFVLRAGYGIYYDSGYFEVNSAQYFNPPQFNLRVFFPSASSLLTLANPFPANGGFTPPATLNVLSPGITGSYMQHWNMDVQGVIGPLGTLSVAYAGSKGTHLIHARDLNQPSPGPGDLQDRRPYPSFANILFIESGADSSFHSLQGSFSRPISHGLSVLAVYSFSKSIDDASGFQATKSDPNFPQNSRSFAAERALSSFDVPHRLALAYMIQLPRNSRWTRDTELRGITTVQSGQPFTPILRFDNSNTGNGGGNTGYDRPNLLRKPALANCTADQWFDTGAFAIADQYHFGNAGRNVLRGPGFASFDLSLARRFTFSDRAALQFEAQAFNLFNRANLELPELYADEPGTFGRIFAAKAPRQLQFALRVSF